MPSFEPVTALLRGLEVLRVVNNLGEATAAEVQKQTELHRPTVVRMLETLEDAGYVTRCAKSTRYMPTGRVLQLSNGFKSHERIGRIAEPILAKVRENLGWPSAIAIPDGSSMLIVYSSRAFEGPRLNGRSGTRAPMLGSALGRAYIAHCPEPAQERILALMRASPPDPFDKPLLDDHRLLKKMLQTTFKKGYALPEEAYTRSIYNDAAAGFAVPVVYKDLVVASINIVFFAAAVSMDEAISSLLPELQRASTQIGNQLAVEHGDGLNGLGRWG